MRTCEQCDQPASDGHELLLWCIVDLDEGGWELVVMHERCAQRLEIATPGGDDVEVCAVVDLAGEKIVVRRDGDDAAAAKRGAA